MFRHTTMTQQNWTYYRKHTIPNRKHCPFLGMLFSKYAAFASFNSSRVQPILYKTWKPRNYHWSHRLAPVTKFKQCNVSSSEILGASQLFTKTNKQASCSQKAVLSGRMRGLNSWEWWTWAPSVIQQKMVRVCTARERARQALRRRSSTPTRVLWPGVLCTNTTTTTPGILWILKFSQFPIET